MSVDLDKCKPLIEASSNKMGLGATDLVAQDVQALLEAAISAGVVRSAAETVHISANERSAYCKAARDRFSSESDDVEFDDEPYVTEPSTDGAFVQAWIWVPREDTNLCRDTSCDEIVGDGGDGYDGYCGNHADAQESSGD